MSAFESHAQAGQDRFAFEMTEHKPNGFYLDVGANDPVTHSNSYALESLGWNGLLVDIVDCCQGRNGTFVRCDASKPNERLLFQYNQMPDVVDFLSVDVDAALVAVLPAIPFGSHIFRVICLEHDVYCRGEHPQWVSRNLLSACGYKLVCGNVHVIPPGMTKPQPFEDFWCHPDFVNPDLVEKYYCNEKYWQDIVGG
jgi:hypothetical protein